MDILAVTPEAGNLRLYREFLRADLVREITDTMDVNGRQHKLYNPDKLEDLRVVRPQIRSPGHKRRVGVEELDILRAKRRVLRGITRLDRFDQGCSQCSDRLQVGP